MKLVYFTKYTPKGPSSRYRSYQYNLLLEKEFDIIYYPLFNDDYLVNLYASKRINYYKIFLAYFLRIFQVIKYLGTNKLVVIEYELLPYCPPLLEYLLYKTNVSFIVDYDDAIFHNYDLHANRLIRNMYKNKIPLLASYAKCIITGSPYLSKYLVKFNSKILEIPTSINYTDYESKYRLKNTTKTINIGWIGSKSTSLNIIGKKEVIKKIYLLNPKITFKLMGFDNNLKFQLNLPNVEFYDWSELEEFNFLNSIDLGIMPLDDTPFNQGKCGFKLIQYMAMGKPTLSTPLEANLKINRDNNNLFATSEEEWINSIIHFSSNLHFYQEVGIRNKDIVKKYYSIESNCWHYKNIFYTLLNVRN